MAILLFMGLAASAALGQSASFPTTKDNSVLGHPSEVWMNCGASSNNRIAKWNQHIMIMDFDTAAINTWVAANPLPGPWDYYEYELFLHLPDGWDAAPKAVQIRTLNCGGDWAEGDGNWGWWTMGTPASVYGYAEARMANPGGTGTIIDPATSLAWTRENGAAVSDLTAVPYNSQNELPFMASSADHGSYVGVILDDDNVWDNTNLFIDDLLNNPLNRGLRTYKNDGGNERVDFREQSGGAYAPYIEARVATYVPPVETYTPGPSVRQYDVDRDTCLGTYETAGNGGAMGYWRAAKGERSGGEQTLVEWNDRTVSTVTAFFDGQLAANKLTLAEALSLGLFKVEYRFAGHGADTQKVINLDTAWSPVDWTEGNGDHIDNAFNWTTPTAATFDYAQDAYIDTGTTRVRDTANVGMWIDVFNPTWVNQQWRHVRGQYDVLGYAPVSTTGTLQQFTGDNWNTVELNEAFWKDLLYNVQDEGTPYETHYNTIGLRHFGNGWGDDDNWTMWYSESGRAPNLLVTILAVPGDAVVDGRIDVFDLAVLANNYDTGSGKTWWDADFNGDGVVDVFDLAILANFYGFETSIAAAGGNPIPEPASLALLALGGLALIRRRRR